MRIAHLVLAHTSPRQVEELVKKLTYPTTDFYIHVDGHRTVTEYTTILSATNIYFVQKRVQVIQGAYSTVQAILNAFEEIIASGIQYDYINLLSGQDYPLKEASFIHQYFALHHGKQFMEFNSICDSHPEWVLHVTKYHFINYNVPGKYKLERLVNKLLPLRRVPNNMELVGYSLSFAITLPAVKYIVYYLNDTPEVIQFFKLSWSPDKFIFQTILYNSVFKKDMVNNNLRWIAGSGPTRGTGLITASEIPAQYPSDCLFAQRQLLINNQESTDAIDAFIDYKVSA